MTLPDILFYVFAFLTLACGALVVANPFSRNQVLCGLLLGLSLPTGAGAARLQFDAIYEPFYPDRIEIVWAADADPLPLDLRVFRRVKKEFSPQVVSNLMALGPFTEADKPRSENGGSPWRVFELEQSRRILSFRPDTGAAFYRDETDADPAGEAPNAEAVGKLALEMLDRFGVGKSNLHYEARTRSPMRYFTEHHGGGGDRKAGLPMPMPLVIARGVVFSYAIDGIETTGLGAGNIRFEFGTGGRLRSLELFDPGLEPVGKYRTATKDHIARWIREGRARVGSYETTGQRRIEVAAIRKLTIKSVKPAYYFPDAGAPAWQEIYPYLRLACEAELGDNDVEDVCLVCPVIAKGLPRPLKVKGDFAVYPGRLYRNMEGNQE